MSAVAPPRPCSISSTNVQSSRCAVVLTLLSFRDWCDGYADAAYISANVRPAPARVYVPHAVSAAAQPTSQHVDAQLSQKSCARRSTPGFRTQKRRRTRCMWEKTIEPSIPNKSGAAPVLLDSTCSAECFTSLQSGVEGGCCMRLHVAAMSANNVNCVPRPRPHLLDFGR